MTTDDPDTCIPIEQKITKAPWKKQALVLGIQLLNADIEVVKEALIQIHEKKKKAKEAESKSKGEDEEIDEMLKTHKQISDNMIKEKEWKKASNNVPLDIHIQMIIFAYETENKEAFENLLKSALIRLKFRRYEVPYVATVDILMSATRDANIPNSFEKLAKDLNAANLRTELAKLKHAHKKKTQNEEEKKEPAKAATKDPKAKDKGKDKDKDKEKLEAEPEDKDEIAVTPEELEQIKHIFVNLLIQRSKNPKNAIVGINVVMIDESAEYDIPENHYAVAVPIRQHDGVYERNKTIPYIMFKRTPNFLRDEEDLLSLVTDVIVITGKSPNIMPPIGYKKIPVDLRQTPHELERAPDVDYVFICYKTDKDINVYERDLLTLKKLSDLTLSIVPMTDPKYQEIPAASRNVDLVYDFELLMDITKNVKDSLLGPVGTFYARERNDQLNCLSRILLNKFILPIRRKMEQFFELKSQGELVSVERVNFKEILLRVHSILAKNTQTKRELTLIYLISSIYLANLCEEDGDFRAAIQIMRSALSRIIDTREHRLKISSQYSTNPVSAMHVSLHKNKIQEMQKGKEERYKVWENMILRKERERIRQAQGLPPLDEDEADEEATEIDRIEREKHLFQAYLIKQKAENEEEKKREPKWIEKEFYELYSTLDDLLNDLHIDVLACLYR